MLQLSLSLLFERGDLCSTGEVISSPTASMECLIDWTEAAYFELTTTTYRVIWTTYGWATKAYKGIWTTYGWAIKAGNFLTR